MNISFLIKRIASLDYSALFEVVAKMHKITKKSRLYLFYDIVHCGLKYQAGYMDYLIFRLDQVPKDKRDTYITRGKNDYIVKSLNTKDGMKILEDKSLLYKKLDDLIKREWLDLDVCSYSDFLAFYKAHDDFIVKPKCGIHGVGVELLKNDQDPKAIYDRLLKNEQKLIEERVKQDRELANIYPYSVNTLRLVTIRKNSDVTVVFACLRVGNDYANVDNLNHGGMAIIIDLQKGELIAPGTDRKDQVFYEHPITKVKIDGYKIPYLKEALELVKKAALRFDDLGYIGWDVAISETGPLIIEANEYPGHDIYQLPAHMAKDHIGLWPRFKKVLDAK